MTWHVFDVKHEVTFLFRKKNTNQYIPTENKLTNKNVTQKYDIIYDNVSLLNKHVKYVLLIKSKQTFYIV